MLIRHDASHQLIHYVQKAIAEKTKITDGFIDELVKTSNDIMDTHIRLGGHTVAGYLKYRKKHVGDYQFWRLYEDYLKQAIELSYDLKNPYYLYPNNLHAAHDRVADEYRAMKDRIEIEKRKADEAQFNAVLSKIEKYSYRTRHLLIRPA